MSETVLPYYPRGQISLGAGDLTQVTDIKFDFKRNTKLKHTLKKSPSGKVLGVREVTGSFDVIVDEDGPEREYFARVDSGEEVNMRLKLPGVTKNFVGCLTDLSGELPLDDAVKLTVSFAGTFTDG